MSLTYLYPNGASAPTQAQMDGKYTKVHCIVTLGDSDAAVDVVHNMQLEETVDIHFPAVLINAMSGGPLASLPTVNVKDTNTVSIGKVASGPGTGVVLDVWIARHVAKSPGFFG